MVIFYSSDLGIAHIHVDANLFDSVESSLTSRQIVRVTNVTAVSSPRPVGEWRTRRKKRKESKLAIRHVVVLGAK